MANSFNSKKSAALRRALLAAVTPRDIFNITKLQVFLALKGDSLAASQVLDRVVGKAVPMNEMIATENAANAEIDRPLIEAELKAMWESVPMLPEYQAGDGPQLVDDSETG